MIVFMLLPPQPPLLMCVEAIKVSQRGIVLGLLIGSKGILLQGSLVLKRFLSLHRVVINENYRRLDGVSHYIGLSHSLISGSSVKLSPANVGGLLFS